jgi:hypothetical protein
MKHITKFLVVFSVCCACTWLYAFAVSVNICENVNDDNLIAADELAGVYALSNWNNTVVVAEGVWTNIYSPVPGVLIDDQGVASPIKISWHVDGFWWSNHPTRPYSGNDSLMCGYGDDWNWVDGCNTVTVENIPYDIYDVYLYVGCDGTNRPGMAELVGAETYYYLTWTEQIDFSSTNNFIQATATNKADESLANYIVWKNQTADGCTLIQQASEENTNNGIFGFQIVLVPEPGFLLGAAAIGALLLRRQR